MWTLTDILFPPRCAVCDGLLKPSERGVCEKCTPKLVRIKDPRCMKCGKTVTDREIYCPDCTMHAHAFESGRALFLYNDAMKNSIYRFKYAGRKEYAAFYADSMAEEYARWISTIKADAIVPIPLHKKRLKERGFNQAELIARRLSEAVFVPVCTDLLIRQVATRKQKELSAKERENNLKKAFKISENDVKLKTVILCDDIYTTGSTIDAVATLLKRSGVQEVYFIALAIGKGF